MRQVCAVRCVVALAGLAPAFAQEPEMPTPRGVTAAYRIGIEDELRIVVWGEKELTLGVKVRPDGTVKVLDFGLAKVAETSSGSAGTSDTTSAVGPRSTWRTTTASSTFPQARRAWTR